MVPHFYRHCRKLLCGLIILFFFYSFSQNEIRFGENYGVIDNKMFNYSKKHTRDFDSVFAYVTQTFTNEEERARGFYSWIVLNINYDIPKISELETQRIWNVRNRFRPLSQDADTVLRCGKAVCEGYSNLFKKFCDKAEISCEMVVGISKTEDGEIVTGILHAWNVIRIGGEWYPVDVTWASGYITPTRQYVRKFSSKYFMPPPAAFNKNHLPLDPMWQLCVQPMSRSKFDNEKLAGAAAVFAENFAFKDSIDKFRAENEGTDKEYRKYLRYYQYDSTQKAYAQNADYALLNAVSDKVFTGNISYDEYVMIIKNAVKQGKNPRDPKKLRGLLSAAEKEYTEAISLIDKKPMLFDEDERLKKESLALVKDNLRMVKEEKERLNKYFGPEKKKSR